jgi:general secretion pathway protein B
MSYILDALKKAERERRVAKIPTLDTVHETPLRRRARWMWLGAAVVLVNAALLLIWLPRPVPVHETSPRSAAVPGASAPAGIDRPPVPAPRGDQPAPASPAATAAAPPEPLPSRGRASTSRNLPETTVRRAEPKASPSLAGAPVAPRIEPGSPPPPSVPARPAPPAPERTVAAVPASPVRPAAAPDKPASPPAPASPMNPPEQSAAPAPGPQELTPADQEGIPKMSLQFLVYSDIPAERLVFINNRKYIEGQSIDGKVVVEGIVPDGAILSYQGKRFKLRQ